MFNPDDRRCDVDPMTEFRERVRRSADLREAAVRADEFLKTKFADMACRHNLGVQIGSIETTSGFWIFKTKSESDALLLGAFGSDGKFSEARDVAGISTVREELQRSFFLPVSVDKFKRVGGAPILC